MTIGAISKMKNLMTDLEGFGIITLTIAKQDLH